MSKAKKVKKAKLGAKQKPNKMIQTRMPSDYDGSTPLDKQRELFCNEYLAHNLNAAEAARWAGYSHKTAASQASRLLINVNVQKRLSYLMKSSIERIKNAEEYNISVDRVLLEVATRAFSNMADYVKFDDDGNAVLAPMNNLSRNKFAGIKELEYTELPPVKIVEMGVEIEREAIRPKIKLHDNAKYLDMLMKHLGLLKERVEVVGMNELVEALQAGRDRVAKLKKERDAKAS